MHPIDFCFARTVTGAIQNFLLLKYLGLPLIPDVLRTDRSVQKALIIRSTTGTIGLVIFINALPLVPIGVLQTII
jgi:hypothetical protein